MKITKMIDQYGKEYSPYMGNLVNHLPMGQLALYKLTEDIDRVEEYSKFYIDHFTIDPITGPSSVANSIEECIGKRELYEECLLIVEKEVEEKGLDSFIREVLNTYPLGMSSGLFHVLIRLAYAKEGMDLGEGLTEEVHRALAYYLTAYREVTPFTRRVPRSSGIEEMRKLQNASVVQSIYHKDLSRGMTMKHLYESDMYLEHGFLFDGKDEEKIQALLDICLPAFDQTAALLCFTV